MSYDGTDFAGSQRQANGRTVQQELEGALGRVFGDGATTVFAGRTDRGVHAAGQVVGCEDRRPGWTETALMAVVNAHLPDDVAVTALARRPPEFHARFDARWREYRYRLWSGPPQPTVRRFVWRRTAALEIGAMTEALAPLLGRHDFASFAGSGRGVPWSDRSAGGRGTVRTILAARCAEAVPWWGPQGGGTLIEVTVVADGFLPQMVRSLVGALVEVGRGAREPTWLGEVLAARDRRRGAPTAAPHGLTLWRVGYGDERPAP